MAVKIGIMLPQEWNRKQIDPIEAYETMTRVAHEAETLGFASLWLFDHVLSASSPDRSERMIFECWTSTAALARDTKRIRIGQVVTNNSLRNPALLAKMASTVDVLSHGRLEVGIGAGWYEQEYRAYGYPYPDTPTRLRQLREALHIIKALWTEEQVFFEGRYYCLHGAINQPKGVQQPHIPLLVGGKGEQVTLKLVARYADACNFTHLTPDEITHKLALLQRYCETIGRNDQEIRHTLFVNGIVAETEATACAEASKASGRFSLKQIRQRGLLGTPEQIRQRLRVLEQHGVQEVIVVLHNITQPETVCLFAECIQQ